jgi:hypothetical protein
VFGDRVWCRRAAGNPDVDRDEALEEAGQLGGVAEDIAAEGAPHARHRPEHTALALIDAARGPEPWAVLGGDRCSLAISPAPISQSRRTRARAASSTRCAAL